MRRVQRQEGTSYDPQQWPYRMAPVAQLFNEGLDLPAGVTFLVGENGSGKSTLVEAIAAAAGLNPEGGSRNARHQTRVSESPLAQALQLIRTPGAASWSYFLRAETMHALYTYLEKLPAGPGEAPRTRLHELSHGESFIDVLAEHFHQPGFYVLDEPEAALSFTSCLALVGVLHSLAGNGGQVLCATHCSPRCPARRFCSWTTPDTPPPSGRTCTSWTTGGATSTNPSPTFGTYSTEKRPRGRPDTTGSRSSVGDRRPGR